MPRRSILIATVGLLGALSLEPGTAHGELLCPRVTSEHNADVTDLLRFRQFARWKDKQGDDLAVAIWQYLCDTETGLYHMNTVNDGPDPWSEYSTVRDPIKLLNIYNVGYCGIFGPVLDGVFQGVGFTDGRAFGVSGWNHCTTEVWYDSGWHYLDLDVRGALRRPDGSIASLAEARTQRDLWVNPSRPIEPFFPTDPNKARIFEIYRDSRIDYYYRWFQMGHVMDFRLRQGESLTRWWRPQGGRWHHIDEYNQGFVRKLLETEPLGYKSNHPEFSVWTQGNGLWHYAPDLTSASSDFRDGALWTDNLEPGPQGLQLQTAGRGEVVFTVFTPWTIVPQVNHLEDPADDEQASVVTLGVAAPSAVSVSLDQGRTWQQVATAQPGRVTIDLTRWVSGTYGYWLKLAVAGQADQLALRTLEIRTWVQVAPLSLPRLKSGVNHCRFDLGDRYGKATRAEFVLPNMADAEDLRKYVVAMPDDWDPNRKTARIRGEVVLKLVAPPQTRIDWLTAGACFSTYQNEQAKNTDNRIAYAVGAERDFQEVYRAQVPTWVNHWRYQWDQDILLDEPAKEVFVKYTGQPAVNVLRATLHVVPQNEVPHQAVRITHAYRLDNRLVEKEVSMPGPGDYTVTVDGDPNNEYIRLAVPSQTRP